MFLFQKYKDANTLFPAKPSIGSVSQEPAFCCFLVMVLITEPAVPVKPVSRYYLHDFSNHDLHFRFYSHELICLQRDTEVSSPHPSHHLFYVHYLAFGASQKTQLVKNPPAMQETPVRFLGWKETLEK